MDVFYLSDAGVHCVINRQANVNEEILVGNTPEFHEWDRITLIKPAFIFIRLQNITNCHRLLRRNECDSNIFVLNAVGRLTLGNANVHLSGLSSTERKFVVHSDTRSSLYARPASITITSSSTDEGDKIH